MSDRNTQAEGDLFVGIPDTDLKDVFIISPDDWEPIIDDAAEDIEQVVEQKPFLDSVLPDLYTSHLNGEDISDPFSSLAQEQLAFGRFTAFINRQTTDAVAGARIIATMARNTGAIDDQTQRAFIDLWEEHSWIAEAIPVALQRQENYYYWTGHGVDVQYRAGEPNLRVQWRAKQGIDDLWDIQAPMHAVLSMLAAVTRFQDEQLEEFLNNRGGSIGLEEEDIDAIDESLERLIENAQAMRETVPRLAEYATDTMEDYSNFDETLDPAGEEGEHDEDLPDYTY